MAIYPNKENLGNMDYSNHRGQNLKDNRRRHPYTRQESELSLQSHSDHSSSSSDSSVRSGKFMHNYKKPNMPAHSQYIAMDCEMVGTLTGKSICARVVIVDWRGRIMMDTHVEPTEIVTDYRTHVSGIREEDLQNAEPIDHVRIKVQSLLTGKILVGHGLTNDLQCLGITHPWSMIRDTAYYEPFMKIHYGTLAPCKLRDLAKDRLQRDVQVENKPHSPTEDAITALDLYKSHRPRWEACVQAKVRESQRMLQQQARQIQQLQQMQQYYYGGVPYAINFQ